MALFQEEPAEFLQKLDDMLLRKKNLNRDQIDQLVRQRTEARTQKDYAKSDQLRDQLMGMGIALQDTPEGTHWEVEKKEVEKV